MPSYEAGVWIPGMDTVWFTSYWGGASYISVRTLSSGASSRANLTMEIQHVNGGYYYGGKLYFTSYPSVDGTWPGRIYDVNPKNGHVETILNSYYGLPIGVDDIAGVQLQGTKYLYFTGLDLTHAILSVPLPPQLDNAVWRIDLTNEVMLPFISRTDISVPNGIRATLNGKSIYITDTGSNADMAFLGISAWGAPAIYQYDVDDAGFLINLRLFGYARNGVADGLHINDQGRVSTGEGDRIIVRSPGGKVLGIFYAAYFLPGADTTPVANFALGGNTLVFAGLSQLWTVKLGEIVVGSESLVIN